MITTLNCLQGFDNGLLLVWRWIRVWYLLHRLRRTLYLQVRLRHNIVRSWLWMLRYLLWNLILHTRVQTTVNGQISRFINLLAIVQTSILDRSITLSWSSLALRILNYLVVASLNIKRHGLIYVVIWRLNEGCNLSTCILISALKIA